MRTILAIDGGGIKGVFPASFLASLEDSLGQNPADFFDLIAGTSTGGIIALGLGLGLSAKEILTFYEQHGPEIFAGNRLLRVLRHIGFSKYSSEPLRRALDSVLGNRVLGESKKRLIIPSCNLDTGEVHIWKTAHHPRLERDYKARAVDVALATTAAPSYFPTHRSAAGTPLVDGGVWANNPMGVAMVEANRIGGIQCAGVFIDFHQIFVKRIIRNGLRIRPLLRRLRQWLLRHTACFTASWMFWDYGSFRDGWRGLLRHRRSNRNIAVRL